MILGRRAELVGRVKLQISGGARGTIDYPWQDNMILDQGFVRLLTSSGNAFSSFGVGSSSQAVQPTDTGLIAPAAFTPTGSTVTRGWNADGGFGWSRASRSFARGAAAGNISELTTGYAANNTSAMARALVRDALGNPTTITVLSDEVLTITWELRRWWSIADAHDLTYLVDSIEHTTTVNYREESLMRHDAYGLGSGGDLAITTNLISTTGGVFIGEFKQLFTENQGNPSVVSVDTQGHAGTGAKIEVGTLMPFQEDYCTFTPPIAKTNEFVLEIRHRISLTRR